MKKKYTFTDRVNFKISTPKEVLLIKDNFAGNTTGKAIDVTIAATHSGYITRNNSFYLPDRMKKGVSTFTDKYNKPIQLHHDDMSDPVGRVIAARYVDTTEKAKVLIDSYYNHGGSHKAIFENLKNRFLDGKLNYIDSVNFVSDFLNQEDSVLDDPNWDGLGYIELTARITDPAAIEKILDGRYQTGSVGASTDSAVCSVCKTDWAGDDGPCDHRPGEIYDTASNKGKKCYMITGSLEYNEYSFVNCPADSYSKIIQISSNGVNTEYVDTSSNSNGKILDSILDINAIKIVDSVQTIKEDTLSKLKELSQKILTDKKSVFTWFEDAYFTAFEITDEKYNVEEFSDELTAELTTAIQDRLVEDTVSFIFDNKDKEVIFAAAQLLFPSINTATVIEDLKEAKDKDAALVSLRVNELGNYKELEDSAVKEISDMSGAQRKRLPASSFVGKNRSFPVIGKDQAEKTLLSIDAANLSSANKKFLKDEVARKVTVLEELKDKLTAPIATVTVPAVKDVVAETVFKDSVDGASIAFNITDKTFVINDKDAKVFIKEITDKVSALELQITDLSKQNTELVSQNKKAIETLDALKEEFVVTYNDLSTINNTLVDAKSLELGALADHLATLTMLSGTKVEDKVKFVEDSVALGEDKLKEQILVISTKLDFNKIIDTINIGVRQITVTDKVEDPTGSLQDQPTPISTNLVKTIKDEFTRITFGGESVFGRTGGKNAAKMYLDYMSKKHSFTEEIVDSIRRI